MRSFNHRNYAFLTLSLRLYERNLVVDSKIVLNNNRIATNSGKRKSIFFVVEIEGF